MNCYYHLSNNLFVMENNENNMFSVSVVWIMIKILQKWIYAWEESYLMVSKLYIMLSDTRKTASARKGILPLNLDIIWMYNPYQVLLPFSVNLSKFFASTFLE